MNGFQGAKRWRSCGENGHGSWRRWQISVNAVVVRNEYCNDLKDKSTDTCTYRGELSNSSPAFMLSKFCVCLLVARYGLQKIIMKKKEEKRERLSDRGPIRTSRFAIHRRQSSFVCVSLMMFIARRVADNHEVKRWNFFLSLRMWMKILINWTPTFWCYIQS